MKPFLQWTAILSLSMVLAGCSGGGGVVSPTATPTIIPTTPGTLTGKQAVKAILTSGYQSYQAAVNYPFAGLQLALPPTSPFKQAAQKGAARKTAVVATIFNETLGLYQGYSFSANTVSIDYYTDAAGTRSAGSSSMISPSGTTVGGNYSYPAVIQIRQNITGGNIPCIGSGTITINNGTGANIIDGTLNLPRTGLKITARLTLSDSGQVGGTATIVGNGQTITLSNLRGPFMGDLTGDAQIAPDGTTGTAVLSLFTGKFEVTLNTSSGTARGSVNSAGALRVTYPDSSSETIGDPLSIKGGSTVTPTATPGPTVSPSAQPTPTATAQPTATPTTRPTATPTPRPTATPVPTGGIYNVPVRLGFYVPSGVNSKGEIIATDRLQNRPTYFSSPTAMAKTLPALGTQIQSARAISNTGLIVGASPAVYWLTGNAPIRALISGQEANGVNAQGKIVGTVNEGSTTTAALWNSPTAAPVLLKPLPGYPNSTAESINANGLIVGTASQPFGAGGGNQVVYWTSATADPIALPGANRFYGTVKVNDAGQIVASAANLDTLYWSSVTAPVTVLPKLAGTQLTQAFDIANDGTIVGASYTVVPDVSTSKAVIWKNGRVQDLNTLIPSNTTWKLQSARGINSKGEIVGRGDFGPSASSFFISPK